MMTCTRPRVEPDGWYNITETAKALGVDRHTVQRYAKQGHLRFSVRKAGRRKVASGKEIVRCWERMYL